MIRPLGTCLILSTTPYAPRPSSQICSRSSAFTSHFWSKQQREQCQRGENFSEGICFMSAKLPVGFRFSIIYKEKRTIFFLILGERVKKTSLSANGKFLLLVKLKMNIFIAWWALKRIPVSPQSKVFETAVMSTRAFFTANRDCSEQTGVDKQ